MLVGVWFTPYLIRNLGVSAYGLVPLTTTLTSYLRLITLGLNSAVGRYLTIEIERGKTDEANEIFNTSLWGTLAVAGVLVIPGVFCSLHAERLLKVPSGYETQAKLLLGCAIALFLITEVAAPFSVATFCRNRFDLRSLVDVTGALVRVGVVVLLFSVLKPQTWYVGLGLLAAGVSYVLLTVVLWRKLLPSLHVSVGKFRKAAVKQLTGTGGWMVVNQIGTLLFLSIDLVVVNRMLGPEAGGRYAAVLQWSALLRGIGGAVIVIFGPTNLYYYARRDFDGLAKYSRQVVKLSGLALALPIGLVCGFSRPLLRLWLGHEFVSLAPLLSLLTIHLAVNLGVCPLFNLQLATNRVRTPGIVTCIMGVGNLGLAILLAGPVGWGMYGVAAAGAVTLTAKNLVFTPIYGAHVLQRRWSTFYPCTIPAILGTLGLTAICWSVSHHYDVASWFRLGLVSLMISGLFAVLVYGILLSADEKAIVRRTLSPSRKWQAGLGEGPGA